MRTRVLFAAAVCASLLCVPRPARAWDELGHRVIARIAWNEMTPAARRSAVQLLSAAPRESGIRELFPAGARDGGTRNREAFTTAATWADLVRDPAYRGHRYSAPDWHYVNWLWNASGRAPAGGRGPGALPEQLCAQGRTLADPRRSMSERGLALAWLLHLVGDVHQPLHTSARISAELPQGDRGGNLLRLAGGETLHDLWDGALGPAARWNVPPARRDDPVGWIAASVAARHPAGGMGALLRAGDPAGWSREGLRIARDELYLPGLLPGRAPSRAYRERAARIAERQAALAGYRLARLLNGALDPAHASAGGLAGCGGPATR
jgi:hypothetical protein